MVQYSRICDQINQQSLGSSPSLDTFSVLRLLDHLSSWYRSVPQALVDRLVDVTASNVKDRAESQMQLALYLQYQEALLIIHDLVEKSPLTCSNVINEMDAQIGPDKVSKIVKHAPGILEHRYVTSASHVPETFQPTLTSRSAGRRLTLEELLLVRPHQGILSSRSPCFEVTSGLQPGHRHRHRPGKSLTPLGLLRPKCEVPADDRVFQQGLGVNGHRTADSFQQARWDVTINEL